MESLSDIETELRTLSQSSKYCELQPTVSGKPISFYFAEIADRIKAAAPTTEKSSAVGNAAATREALEAMNRIDTKGLKRLLCELVEADIFDGGQINKTISAVEKARRALSAPPHKGKWKNGTAYEYEYAYCSECGRMQWASWDTHKQARENIESFADEYRYCPGCGAEMEGGVYVE